MFEAKFFNSSKDPSHVNADFFELSLSFFIREFVGYTAFAWRVEVSRGSDNCQRGEVTFMV